MNLQLLQILEKQCLKKKEKKSSVACVRPLFQIIQVVLEWRRLTGPPFVFVSVNTL